MNHNDKFKFSSSPFTAPESIKALPFLVRETKNGQEVLGAIKIDELLNIVIERSVEVEIEAGKRFTRYAYWIRGEKESVSAWAKTNHYEIVAMPISTWGG